MVEYMIKHNKVNRIVRQYTLTNFDPTGDTDIYLGGPSRLNPLKGAFDVYMQTAVLDEKART